MEYGWWTLLPPLGAVILALWSRRVLASLLAGIFLGYLVLSAGNPAVALVDSIEGILVQLQEGWKVKTLLFVVMVGGVMVLLERSGGVEAFVAAMQRRHIASKRGALLLGYGVGLVIFLESSITALIVGTVTRPFGRHYGISSAKLAYLCDSTSAPVCTLIPFNGWGALLLGLIGTQIGAGVIGGSSLELFVASIPFNFYALVTLFVLMAVIVIGKDIGPMASREAVAQASLPDTHEDPSFKKGGIGLMLWPIIVMLATVPAVLYLSGKGDMFAGSGSSAIFYAVLVTLGFMLVQYGYKGVMSPAEWRDGVRDGIGNLLPVGAILLLAFTLSDITVRLQTGAFLASQIESGLNASMLAAIIFPVAALVSFSTGTSWGTFGIMMPIALPMAAVLDAHIPLVIAAVVSGGIFGDHASPISDTTIISSMAAECDLIEHVRTQLPYALISASIALGLFALFGWFLG